MINKTTTYIACIAAVVAIMLTPLLAMGQQAVGSWYSYPLYSGAPSRIVATPTNTYYLALGRLYGYTTDDETFTDYVNELSSSGITMIEYNPEKKFLFIAYNDANIDLLYDDGRLVNLPDIKDAVLDYTKAIKDVEFSGDRMYVATSFGLVEYDLKRHVVKQSGIYGKSVDGVSAFGDKVVIAVDSELLVVDKDKIITRLDDFTQGGPVVFSFMRGLGGANDKMVLKYNNGLRVYGINSEGLPEVLDTKGMSDVTDFKVGPNGTLYVSSGNKLWQIETDGTFTELGAIPSTLASHTYGTWSGLNGLWAGDAAGIGLFDISTNPATVRVQKMTPPESLSVERVYFIVPSGDNESLYIGNIGPYQKTLAGTGNNEGTTIPQQLNRFRNGTIEDLSMSAIKGQAGIAQHPTNPNRYYIATRSQGIRVIEDGRIIGSYTQANTPRSTNDMRFFSVAFDADGNLWTTIIDTGKTNSLRILPAAKANLNPSEVKAEDWICPTVASFQNNREGRLLICKLSPFVFMTSIQNNDGLLVYNTNGTTSNFNDDTVFAHTRYFDTDGNSFSISQKNDLCEDKNGKIWIASNTGPYVIDNPADAMTADLRLTRPKVPRNDGTNYADYLLDGIWLTSIAVDANNRKWIGTRADGLYYVSENGDEILAHFDESNSPLPTNAINAVYCDPASNLVYIGTNYGLLAYSSMSSPSADDFSEVYAFPNPVRPEYTGWITVTGLMNNSLVKITDAAGNIVASGRSNGGMFTWDGCNGSGSRVKSGVYYVFASQNEGGDSNGAVTKILIMN